MNLSNLAAYLVLILLIQTCYSTEPDNGDPPKPPGYQEDIPWPSLADSPWPMNRGNPQTTGRSRYPGPQNGILEWEFDSVSMNANIVIGEDSTIYFNASSGLYAVKPDGELKWRFDFKDDFIDQTNTPLIGADGTIYTAYYEKILYAINPNGTTKWELLIDTQGRLELGGMNIGLDGTIYMIDTEEILYAISSDGSVLWTYHNSDLRTGNAAISISPDGKTLYLPGTSRTVYAFNLESNSVIWTFGNSESKQAPVIDCEGNIYLQSISDNHNDGKPSFYSLSADGSVRWSYVHNNRYIVESFNEPTMDKFGNTYFLYDTLYSIGYNGTLKWKMKLRSLTMSLVCDVNSNVYVNYANIPQHISTLSINSQGDILWERIDIVTGRQGNSPSLGYDVMYVPTTESGNFYSIK